MNAHTQTRPSGIVVEPNRACVTIIEPLTIEFTLIPTSQQTTEEGGAKTTWGGTFFKYQADSPFTVVLQPHEAQKPHTQPKPPSFVVKFHLIGNWQFHSSGNYSNGYKINQTNSFHPNRVNQYASLSNNKKTLEIIISANSNNIEQLREEYAILSFLFQAKKVPNKADNEQSLVTEEAQLADSITVHSQDPSIGIGVGSQH